MVRAYYFAPALDFLGLTDEDILGKVLVNNEFETTDLQRVAWKQEINILKEQLMEVNSGDIILEYTIPRIGHRIDAVYIFQGIVFVLEFKIGEHQYRKADADQVMDYALDLKYFHEESKNLYIVPMLIASEASDKIVEAEFVSDKISNVILCNKNNIGQYITAISKNISPSVVSMNKWVNSRYFPVPTIVEAAQFLYQNHTVENILQNEAGIQNLTNTTAAINRIIDDCKRNHKKAICFITGVPGAGKTLAGLNIASERHCFQEDEHAVFLSGNGPLVDVLQTALAKKQNIHNHVSLAEAKREVKSFIQIIHKFRDEALITEMPPIEKVVIFDEAQRAWDAKALSSFMAQKKGISDFNKSEPEFLIDIMDRHKTWSVIICLVGNGQEIYKGEAGIAEWFSVLKNKFCHWNIYFSDKMAYLENSKTFFPNSNGHIVSSLHLGVSLRSFRNEKVSLFIKQLLDNKPHEAAGIYSDIKELYPIFVTRNLEKAKKWVRCQARGNERFGMLASSGAKRLRGEGIWVLPKIDHVAWFLGEKSNVNSSYFLEVPASEFKVQGLEIDFCLIAWDADLRYVQGRFDFYKFRGSSWQHINLSQDQVYLKNAYRVLLTRARQGFVIYVPAGANVLEDVTRDSEIYDSIFEYLKSCGIQEID